MTATYAKITARKPLADQIIEKSVSNSLQRAVREWKVTGCRTECDETCVCGQQHIKYAFQIRNKRTGETLYPIGSDCIKKFYGGHMYNEATVIQQICMLADMYSEKQLSWKKTHKTALPLEHYDIKEGFSRKILEYMYDHNAFRGSKYNHWKPEEDFEFTMHCFNNMQVNPRQEKKMRVMAMNCVRWAQNFAKLQEKKTA